METTIRLVTVSDLCQSIAIRWKSAHPYDVELTHPLGADYPKLQSDVVLKALEELKPEERTPKNITDIIGNSSWVYLRCDVCKDEQDKVVAFGTAFDVKYICQVCNHIAWKLF